MFEVITQLLFGFGMTIAFTAFVIHIWTKDSEPKDEKKDKKKYK